MKKFKFELQENEQEVTRASSKLEEYLDDKDFYWSFWGNNYSIIEIEDEKFTEEERQKLQNIFKYGISTTKITRPGRRTLIYKNHPEI